MAGRVEVAVSCTNLTVRPTATGVICVLKVRRTSDEKWSVVDQTDVQTNLPEVTFGKSFLIEAEAYPDVDHTQFRLAIFGVTETLAGPDHDLHAQATVPFRELLQCGGKLSLNLEHPYRDKINFGVLHLTVAQIQEHAQFEISATKLPVKEFFGILHPVLTVWQLHDDETREQVHTTEVVPDTVNPIWQPFAVSVQRLCGGDPVRPLLFEVLDEDVPGKYVRLGAVQTSLAELLSTPGAKSADLECGGQLHFLQVRVSTGIRADAVSVDTTDMASLIKALAAADDRVRLACCRALINLTHRDSDLSYRNGFREHGGIAAVLSMMCETDSTEVLSMACWVLKNVACSEKNRQAMRRAGCVPVLLQCGQHPDTRVQVQALWALANMTHRHDAAREDFLRFGGVSVVIHALQHSDAGVREQALWLLSSVTCENGDIRDSFREQHGFTYLLPLLRGQPEAVLCQAARAVKNLCVRNNMNRTAVRQGRGIVSLVFLLHAALDETRTQAAEALASACYDSILSQDAVRENEGLAALWKLARSAVAPAAEPEPAPAAIGPASSPTPGAEAGAGATDMALLAGATEAPVVDSESDTESRDSVSQRPSPVSRQPSTLSSASSVLGSRRPSASVPGEPADGAATHLPPLARRVSMPAAAAAAATGSAAPDSRRSSLQPGAPAAVGRSPRPSLRAVGLAAMAVNSMTLPALGKGTGSRRSSQSSASLSRRNSGVAAEALASRASSRLSLLEGARAPVAPLGTSRSGLALLGLAEDPTDDLATDGQPAESQRWTRLERAAIAALQVLVYQNDRNRLALQKVAGSEYRPDLFG